MSKEFKTIDVNAMAWEEEQNAKAGASLFKKDLVADADTGMQVSVTKYPKGFINPKHDHPCAHGMYVLKGVLHTSKGDFGPGSFVWFPEGEIMWHGATENQDVEIIFITNKKFAINYL
ncbi:MAG: cupin domain-containing protein [Spirochaetaceae bacterium]|jgi:quercetin dioxygenase-like cupin family protein|nr:cupin domain-containing protein [Spirochaetaceae bacterium]